MVRTAGSKEEMILRMLISKTGGEMYGLEMVEAAKGGLPRGTVYVTLDRMEDKGLVSSKLEERGADFRGTPRRLYKITGAGQTTLRALDAARHGFSLALDGGITS